MDFNKPEYQTALDDFRGARQRAALQDIIARLTGRSNRLLSYEEVEKKLKLGDRSDRGVKQIPLAAIVGSVGRYTDFTRTFLPLDNQDQERWARVKAATTGPASPGMLPIDVYQVGEAYFVLDGNHRVSIARQEGMPTIDAHVIEVHTAVPLSPDTAPDDLILKAEFADFLEQTRAGELLPGVDLTLTVPGQYEKLKEHIDVHQYFMGLDLKRDIPYDEAVKDWYETVYLPIANATRERGLLRWFPNRTEADLYLWVSEHRAALEKELGWTVRPEAAATDLAVKQSSRAESRQVKPGSWREAKMYDRYTEHLFQDILVPLSGHPESWSAFDQALVFAGREGAHLHGLHIVKDETEKGGPKAQAIQAEFKRRCEAAGVPGSLLVEAGEIASKVSERAVLTDLVIVNAAHPPERGLHIFGSGLRSILMRCARPVLAVSSGSSPLDRALLAFDGSPKSKEALFVATYLAEQWKVSLTVVAVLDQPHITASVLDYPRAYLDLHELQAQFITAKGPVSTLKKVVDEHAINLLLMGSYSFPPLIEVVRGSAVSVMLREMRCPIFICR